ncbi:ATP-dependent DNA ligase [Streptomyces cinerochromogenes]|uniref:ATP-dependent DNA ligase n=1 Tax=Streptomyces cinerochromogenes TaxID=66422 RepID=UPI001E3240DF|nr:hypothetical protein [Streptomyces cinerochromogenes]
MQSRRGALIKDRFPDLVASAEQFLPGGLVLDGELVVGGEGGRLSFEALQRRAASRGRTAVRLAAEMPASFVAFDVLRAGGEVLLAERRASRAAGTDQGLRLARRWAARTRDSARGGRWAARVPRSSCPLPGTSVPGSVGVPAPAPAP